MTHLWHPRTGTTALLPQLAAATELLVIDLVAQHDPQPDPQFAGGGDARFAQPLLLQLAPVKALQLGIPTDGVHAGLTPEKTQQRIALLTQPTEPLPATAGIFAGDHPHVAHHRFAVGEARRVA